MHFSYFSTHWMNPSLIFTMSSFENSNPRQRLMTLGARGHLPGGHIEVTLRFLKQFVHTLPRGYMLDSFEMYPPL